MPFENERRCPYAREQSVGARGFRYWLATGNWRRRSAAVRPPRARGRNASPRPADHAARTCAFGVFVGKDRGARGVKRRVVIGMAEVPVGVDDVFQRSIAKAIESLFEPGPGG